MSTRSVVIARAGHGGVQTAASLRKNGFDGRIMLVGDEPSLPYQGPPLSKAYLQGKMQLNSLWLRPENFYSDNKIELMEARLTAIEPAARRVTVGGSDTIEYDHVLSVEARNRRLPLEGAELDVFAIFAP